MFETSVGYLRTSIVIFSQRRNYKAISQTVGEYCRCDKNGRKFITVFISFPENHKHGFFQDCGRRYVLDAN